MTRSLPEWIGTTPDTAIPARVRLRVFEAKDGRCGQCTRKITAGEPWTLEHIKALVNGGENREANLGVTCSNCLTGKNAADLAEKATIYRKKAKHLGIKAKYSRTIPGSKASGWKRKMSGEVVRREKP